jgi:hypothetical protein
MASLGILRYSRLNNEQHTWDCQNAPQSDNKTGVTYLTIDEENVFPQPPFQRRLRLTPARSKVTDCLFHVPEDITIGIHTLTKTYFFVMVDMAIGRFI